MAEFRALFDSDQDSADDVIDHIPKTPGPVTVRDSDENDRDEDDDEDEDAEDDEEEEGNNKEDGEDEEMNSESKGRSGEERSQSEADSEEDEPESHHRPEVSGDEGGGGSEAKNQDSSESENENDSEVERSEEENESEARGSPQQSDSEIEVERPQPSDNSHDEEEDREDHKESAAADHSGGDQSEEEQPKSDEESKSENEESRSENENEEAEGEGAHRRNEDDDQESNDSMSQKRKLSIVEDQSSGSEDSDAHLQRKKAKIESDEEEEEEEEDDDPSLNKSGFTTSTQEIFGEMSSEGEDNEDKRASKEESSVGHDSPALDDTSRNEEDHSRGYEDGNNSGMYFGDEPAEEPIPETRIDVEIPRIVANLGQEITFVKLPNFLSVDTHPYDPSWYDEEGLDDEEGGFDDEGRARVKLKVENTMRWRNVPGEDGVMKKESNTRIVKWSDGSLSLHLGQEIFDIHKQQLMPGDNNHLFVRQGTGLQGQAVFRNKLTFRPHSTDSFTHRKMTLSLADRSQKTQKIRVLPTVGKDPEAHRSEMIKREEDKLKASIRRENKQRRMRERVSTRGPTAAYLENDNYDDEDEDGAISLSAIKNKYKKGGAGYNVYTESEGSEDSDLDILDKKKASAEKKKPKIVEESDDDE